METRPASQIRSNPVSFYLATSGPTQEIFTNTRAGTSFVVTFLTVLNTSSSSGASILLIDRTTFAAVHSGNVGAGSFDRFPLTCELAFPAGSGMDTEAVTGNWSVAVTGRYEPETVGT